MMTTDVLNLLLDSKHIANMPAGPGAGRWAIWRSSLHLSTRLAKGPGEINLVGYRVSYLDPVNLARMFRDLFIHRVYDVPVGTEAPTIVDCGSNVGLSILFFKDTYPRARVIGFEPNPLTSPVLRQNMEQNGLRDVTLHDKAVADTPGSVDFYVNPGEPGALNAGFYGTHHNTRAVSVEAIRLSPYIDGDVDLLKLDIEGAEEMVIRELAEAGVLRRVRTIVCEYHHHHHRYSRDSDADSLSVILATLERAGFGYQLAAYYAPPRVPRVYQDIMLYAYRK